jgi:aldehyde:ferredoxin oxidoreductase
MGSKRLKAVVARGKQVIPMADAERMKADRRKYLEKVREHGLYKVLHEFGTCGITLGSVKTGDAPIKNWAGSYEDIPNAADISDASVTAIQTKRYGCWNCPIACGGYVSVPSGPFAVQGAKPEYETIGAFGTMALNTNIASISRANDTCNRYGLDTISVGATVAFAIECYEKGVITKKDTGGLELTWGNAEAIVALTEQIAKREGFGAVLADGMARAVEKLGRAAAPFAMHVHGEELPMHDPRCSPALTVTYKLDATPARHTQFSAWCAEADYIPTGLEDRFNGWTPAKKYEYAGKGKASRVLSALMHVVNSAGICQFGFVCTPAQGQVDFLNGAMGVDWTMDDVLKIGDRIGNLRVAFNLREGVRNIHFRLPGRICGSPPLKAGPLKDVTVDVPLQEREYLEAMGWNKDGVPTKETLRDLGLDFVIPDLYPNG